MLVQPLILVFRNSGEDRGISLTDLLENKLVDSDSLFKLYLEEIIPNCFAINFFIVLLTVYSDRALEEYDFVAD